MYLVVLLATFMSAIYGYNLSARPDYDRDIPKKKASALMYRFVFQHNTARRILTRIKAATAPGYTNVVPFILPGDLMFSDSNAGEMTGYAMRYDQVHPSASDGSGVTFMLRETDLDSDAKNYLQIGLKLIDGNEMASKVLCVNRMMSCTDADSGNELCKDRSGVTGAAKMCDVDVDPSDPSVITDTCCTSYKARGGTYLVSFMKLDPRWKSRVTGTLNFDFWRAVLERGSGDNIGIITWETDHWKYRGKLVFYPAYAKEYTEWNETHLDRINDPFPTHKMIKTEWNLPVNVFTRDFFKVNNVDYCENGCLFHIRAF